MKSQVSVTTHLATGMDQKVRGHNQPLPGPDRVKGHYEKFTYNHHHHRCNPHCLLHYYRLHFQSILSVFRNSNLQNIYIMYKILCLDQVHNNHLHQIDSLHCYLHHHKIHHQSILEWYSHNLCLQYTVIMIFEASKKKITYIKTHSMAPLLHGIHILYNVLC